jgi:hypothetical protein
LNDLFLLEGRFMSSMTISYSYFIWFGTWLGEAEVSARQRGA